MTTSEHFIPNGDGWDLQLFQTSSDATFVRGRRPVLIVPGYGMNSFIFSYHPSGLSLEAYLVQQGFEVWRANLRGQGGSKHLGPKRMGDEPFQLEDLALTDLPAIIDATLDRSRTGADRVDTVGASLGGTLMLMHAVVEPRHRMGSLVAIGSPIRWVEVHPAVKVLFGSPKLAGWVMFRGTRGLARHALAPLAKLTPGVLSIYMNAGITDTSAANELVKTVEDPNRHVNREIATWMHDKDLTVRGMNLSTSLGRVHRPFLCVLASADGIVPRRTAEYPFTVIGSPSKRILEAGTPELPMAHADLFISRESQARVFEPLARWLEEQGTLREP